jgi:hypothetical protein
MDALVGALGQPRLAGYLRHSGMVPQNAVRLYAWNLEVSSSLWGPLALLEVTVRNAIDAQLRNMFGEDWWAGERDLLSRNERLAAQQTVQKFSQKIRGVTSPDAFVANSTLGFWVGLVGPGQRSLRHYDYETSLWQPGLFRAFPLLPQARRKLLHHELNVLRGLRNRIAHHEPIHHMDIGYLRDLIVRVTGYVEPDVADFVLSVEQVSQALNRREDALSGPPTRV